MSLIDELASIVPGVEDPKTHLSFRQRLMWTTAILLLFLALSQVVLYGVAPTTVERFQFFELILGSSIGSLLTLGIGPIVTASIILQLLVGSKLIPINTKTPEGKKQYQGIQKIAVIFFCFFEAWAYVSFGAIAPASADPSLFALLIIQIAFGGFLVLLMDEVISKWGIGSGVSLFIAAGVTKTIFIRVFNPLTPAGSTVPAGILPQFISLLGLGEIFQGIVALLPIFSTILVFLIVVYVQAIKVEIPLAFGSIRGFSRRWPLNLLYTSNIPVILVAALLANLQLVARLTAKATEEGLTCGILGCFDTSNRAVSGLATFLQAPTGLPIEIFFLTILSVVFLAAFSSYYFKFKNPTKVVALSVLFSIGLAFIITYFSVGLPLMDDAIHAIAYLLILVGGSTIFAIFWVATSGMDARSVAEQIEGLGMQIPGFRRDPRVVEEVLERYIPTITIISGVFIGTLAALADFTGALGSGTGILLTVMIIYNLYENIASRYVEDMNPALRKFFS